MSSRRMRSGGFLLCLGLAEALDFGFVAGGEVGLGGAEVGEEFFAHGVQHEDKRTLLGEARKKFQDYVFCQ